MREDKIQALLKTIDDEGIDLMHENFLRRSGIQGIYLKLEGIPPIIGIDRSIIPDFTLYTCVLAEELGHHFTTVGDLTGEYYSYRDKLIVSKEETLALKWATEFLMPLEELQHVKDLGMDNIYEVSDYLGVTREFLLKRFEFLRKQNIHINLKTSCV